MPEIVGQSLRLNGTSHTIVGVLPAAFSFFDKPVDVYLPVGLHGADPEWMRRGNHPGLLVLARLRRGTSVRDEFQLFAGLSKRVDLRLVDRLELGSGAVAMRYQPRQEPSGL